MKKHIAEIAVVVAGIAWGLIALFVDYMKGCGLAPAQIVAVRFTAAALVMWLFYAIFARDRIKIKLKDLPLLFFLGFFGMALNAICYYITIAESGAAVAAVLLYTSPIFILLASVVLFKEKMNIAKGVALVLVFAGCILISGIIGSGGMTPTGFLIGLLSGLFYASYSIIGVFALRRYSSATVMLYAITFGALGAVVLSNPVSTAAVVASQPNIPLFIFMAIVMGFVTSIIPYGLYTFGLSRMEAGKAGILSCIEPLTAAFVGVVILGEQSTLPQWIGMALILVAVVLLQAVPVSREKDPHEEKDV